MKKTFKVLATLACVALVCSCSGKKSEAPKGENYQISDSQLAAVQKAINGGETPAQKAKSIDELLSVESTQMDSLSYCLGANMGKGVKYQLGGTPFNLDVVEVGVVKGYAQISKQTHEESIEVLRNFFSEEFGKRQAEYQKVLAADSTAVFNPFTSDEEREKVSYAFGHDVGNNLKNAKLPLQLNWLLKGFKEGWNDQATMNQEEIMNYLNRYFMIVMPAQNEARSKAWIEAKKQEEGVQSTESGLAYKVIEAGDMSKAAKNDTDVVKVHYVGKLQDGTVFDASRFENRSKEQQDMIRKQQPSLFDDNGNLKEESEPIEFPLNRVIKGWTEGMKLVGPGGKIVLYIPADLAYGRMGGGQLIGPNEALEFEVELIEVKPAEVEAPAVKAK
jgi:FKBP-type peptidyl-prolyl cis-trans isomerase FkpA